MNKYKKVCKILNEIGNVSVSLNAYETPARPFKKGKINIKKAISKLHDREKDDYVAMLRDLHKTRGDK